MNAIALRPVTTGPAPPDLAQLDRLAARLAQVFHVSVTTETSPLDAGFAYSPERRQYYSTPIVAALAAGACDSHVLGVTPLDLYVPVLTYVFGEAQLPGRAALVSLHRLDDRFYGLPADPAALDARLTKEAIHELGHTLGLRHCDDWSCAMAATHNVQLLDQKQAALCPHCREQAERSIQF
jgi:archaemetzincin